ncbi:MAG: glycosyltransferase [Deltaproteobacteria bacterium]|nr:glycosyltransferase [Deltaproteobacteria bacterium]
MVFGKNLEYLKAADGRLAELVAGAGRSGDIPLVPSKTGPPSARAGGVALHSLYDPIREAKEWVEHNRGEIDRAAELVVLGFGLGYHVAELSRTTDKPVTVFEPRIEILRAALRASDLSAILSRVRIVEAPDGLSLRKRSLVLQHIPSVRSSPAPFSEALARLDVLRAVARGLRIAVVGPFYGGSLPIAGYCAEALGRLGHEVEYIDNSPYANAFLSIDKVTESRTHRDILRMKFGDFASEAVLARIVQFRPDLVLALAQAPLTETVLARLREQGIATAFWFVEDFRHMEYWRAMASSYNYFFAIQNGAFLGSLREAGAVKAAFLPLAASPDIHRKMELSADEEREFGGDVSFVGAGYYNRRKLFEGLTDFDFRIWGNEWDSCPALQGFLQRNGARIGTEEIVRIFNAARININLHSSSYHEGVNPDGDFVNPRTFEIAACGGFQLVDFRSGLPGFFDIGEEIVCFDALEDLRGKIAHYLAHPDEREAVACKGRQRVLRDHTYEQRMEEMIGFMVRNGFVPPWREKRDREDPERLIEEAGPETELGRYLARFADARSLKLPDIIGEIRSGHGELSRVERIFLALNEIRA